MMRTVGILGGMGPEATVALMARIVSAVPAIDDRDHIPLIVDQNSQVPSRIAALIEGTGEDPGPTLERMARGLVSAGAEALAMPCNTAHYYRERVKAAGVPFLDMVVLAARAARAHQDDGAPIGVLCSPSVRMTGLYDDVLDGCIYGEDAPMLAAIQAVKKGDLTTGRDLLRAQSERALKAGATTQILGCSEFSIITDAPAPECVVVDALDVLVEEIVKFSQNAGAEN